MPFSVKPHLPLISKRIEFQINQLPPPPAITLRKDLGKHVKRQIRRKKTPYSRNKREESISSPICVNDETESESSLSPLPEDESSSEEGSADGPNPTGKVPKPPGEAGRRNSGGFNLEKALGWETDRYNAMIKYVNDRVVKKLNTQKCFSGQKSDAIRQAIQDVVRKFRIEDVYVNDWPIREALKLRLKYTSESARKQRVRRTEKTLKKAVQEAQKAGESDD